MISLRQHLERSRTRTDLAHFIRRQFWVVPTPMDFAWRGLALQPDLNGMVGVLALINLFQVGTAIIGFVAIAMIGLFARLKRPIEGFEDKSMNGRIFPRFSDTKNDSQVSIRCASRRENSIFRLRSFLPGIPSLSDISQIRHFIASLISNNRQPNFHAATS